MMRWWRSFTLRNTCLLYTSIIGLDQLGIPEGDALLLHYTLDSGDITDENGADHTGLLGSGHGLDGCLLYTSANEIRNEFRNGVEINFLRGADLRNDALIHNNDCLLYTSRCV